MMLDLPGEPPAVPPWGQRPVGPHPGLSERIDPASGADREVAVVLGAGGAFAPDLIRALKLRGTGAVIGVDRQLTYPVKDVVYRRLDLTHEDKLRRFFDAVRRAAEAEDLVPGPVFDLSTVQTSPTHKADRNELQRGKRILVDVLCERPRDVQLFYMSTAEIYGAPEGAPYREDHVKEPFNDYGREKRWEEETLLEAHGRSTRDGTLRVVALRSWTIAMVETDGAGRIVETRNYNDPMVAVAERLSRLGVRVPVVDPSLRANFHRGEEVAEVALKLGCAPPEASTWGRPFNCPGRSATHGDIVEIAFEVFSERSQPSPWWTPLLRALIPSRLPRRSLILLGQLLERFGGLAGARDLSSRLPFLYRSTHLDDSALREAIGDRLHEPDGGQTEEAVRRMAVGLRNGGDEAVNQARYRLY